MADLDSISVLLFIESRYKVNRKRIKTTAKQLIKEQGIHTAVEVSIAIVGDRKMRALHKKYKGLDKTTNVLSFPLSEGQATVLPSDVMRLGDVVLSFPQVIRDASRDDVLVDDKIDELTKHGLSHLLGIHHE